MSCLATWKEGNRKYLVAMMNHSHVYNDESRYRCFIYQKQRGHRGGQMTDGAEVSHKSGGRNRSGNSAVKIKMAMSAQASCLGLWSVNEGYKTFELKKRKLSKHIIQRLSWLRSDRASTILRESVLPAGDSLFSLPRLTLTLTFG